jgi:streptogramin lyase
VSSFDLSFIMRKTILILLLALWPALAHAQSLTTVASALKGGATLPATCKPATSGSRTDVFVKTGSSAGLYTCSAANTWTAVGGASSAVTITNPVTVLTSGASYTVLSTDYIVIVNKASGSATALTLPSSPATGRTVWIKDGKGDAGSNRITISPAAGTIDGASTYVIDGAYGAITLIYNGTQWNVF